MSGWTDPPADLQALIQTLYPSTFAMMYAFMTLGEKNTQIWDSSLGLNQTNRLNLGYKLLVSYWLGTVLNQIFEGRCIYPAYSMAIPNKYIKIFNQLNLNFMLLLYTIIFIILFI